MRWGVALGLLGSIVGPRAVFGHAVPTSSDPAPNATLSEAPHEIVIRFSERVDGRASTLEVLDAHGQRVDHGDATVDAGDPWRYRVGVHGVGDGVYTVAWRVLSADDGHVTDGAHVFAVGTAVAPGTPARVTPRGAALRPLARWLTLVGCAVVLGIPLARSRLGPALGRPGSIATLTWLSAAAILTGGALDLLLQAHELTAGRPLVPVVLTLFTTKSGAVWVARAVLLALLVVLASGRQRPERRGHRLIVLGLASAVVVSGGLVSHSAGAGDDRGLALGAEALHLLAVAVWVGGLLGFVRLFRASSAPPALAATRQLGLAIPAFSQFVVPAVGLLGASGLVLARVHVTAWGELLTTPYGRWLTAKLLVFAAMVALGGYHQLVIHGRLRAAIAAHSGDVATVTRFGRTLRAEAVLGIVALLLAAVLGVTAPPAPSSAEPPAGFRHERTVDEAHLRLDVIPLRPGPNTIRVRVVDRAGRPLTDASAALVQFVPSAGGVGPATFSLTRTAPGTFETAEAVLGIVGRWDGRLVVQREGAYDINDRFELLLGETPAMHQHAHGRSAPLDAVAAWSIAGITLATAILWAGSWRTQRTARRLVADADRVPSLHPHGGMP
jgi:copper transport protein